MNVALLGLGQMGAGMAGRLIEAGHSVTVWNRDRAKVVPFAQRGAQVAQSPAEAGRVGVVLTMLANDQAIEAVCFGQHSSGMGGRQRRGGVGFAELLCALYGTEPA